jgi:hypothetical protein
MKKIETKENHTKTTNPIKKDGKMLSDMFKDRASTEFTYDTMRQQGYTNDDINLAMRDYTHKEYLSEAVKEAEIGIISDEGAGKESVIVAKKNIQIAIT